MMQLAVAVTRMRAEYDAIVIGSGYGGSVFASRLARAGFCVAVLERGREVRPGEFPTNAASFARASQVESARGRLGDRGALFRFVLDDDCSAAMGCGLGGTSLINAGVALRPDASTWAEDRWPSALRADRDGLLRESFERAEAMLRPTPSPSMPRMGKLDALEAAARALGLGHRTSCPPLTIAFTERTSAAGVPQPACSLCGDCLTGCNTGAKTTLVETYLADAAAHGAEIFTEVDVKRVERSDGSWLVHYDPIALERERFGGEPLFLRARVVVLAAGSLGSTEILLRSQRHGLRLSAEVGRRFSGNGTTLAFACDIDRRVESIDAAERAIVGPAISGMIETDGLIIQETSVPRPLGRMVRLSLRSRRRSIDRTQAFAVTARDDSGGTLVLDGERLRIRWPGAGLQPVVRAIHDRVEDVARALGGHFAPNTAWSAMATHPTITTHPLGGCAMGESGATGVVDHRGRVFSGNGTELHEGLLVADGSIFPGALGCNPLLTITALAERAATLLLNDTNVRAPKQPPRATTPAAVKPFRFTERMSGTLTIGEDTSPLSFVCTLLWDDLDALMDDPSVSARSIGTVSTPALSPHALRVVEGTFRLLVPHADGSLRMKHTLLVEDRGGARWFLDGHKIIDRARGRNVWFDTTTLFFTLHHAERPVGHGEVRVRVHDLLRQISTMRGPRARFLSSFLARMREVYAPFPS